MISRTDLTAAFLRTFAIQGSWNYRTLLGGGLAYAMLPLLVRIHSGDPVALRRAVRRHASSFNGRPGPRSDRAVQNGVARSAGSDR
jgi:PTS system mannose-specific IID component